MPNEVIEEIRCALAMRDAGYAALLGHEASAELLRCCDEMRKALEAMLVDPPATLDEPDTDAEVIIKMRAIARDALAAVKGALDHG
jgi:hypothetical protein